MMEGIIIKSAVPNTKRVSEGDVMYTGPTTFSNNALGVIEMNREEVRPYRSSKLSSTRTCKILLRVRNSRFSRLKFAMKPIL